MVGMGGEKYAIYARKYTYKLTNIHTYLLVHIHIYIYWCIQELTQEVIERNIER
jgi:hypothetical protein